MAGVVAGYGIAVPLGAVGTYLVALGARAGLRAAGPAALGVATADLLYALVAVLGGTRLAGALAGATQPLRWVAFAVLLVLAARIAATGLRDAAPVDAVPVEVAPVDAGHRAPNRAVRTYGTMLAATLLNPATVVYFAALVVAGGGAVGHSPVAAGMFVAGAFLASASWQLLLAAGGTALGRAVTGPLGRRVMAWGSAALVASLALSTVLR